MGITIPKGYRYPEPTTEARTVHTRIKELADDMNATLTDHDNRMLAAENTLATRGVVISRYANTAGIYTHSANDGVNRTINQHVDQFYIPYNARTAYVCIGNSAQAASNAACSWTALVAFTTGGIGYQSVGNIVSHNQNQPALDMGFFVSDFFDVTAYRGNFGTPAINCANDATSGSWIHNGNMHWSVTLIS